MKISLEKQQKALEYVRHNLQTWQGQSSDYREQMLQIYEALSTFELPDTGDVLTRFKVNKAHEILRKVVPKIIAKSPRFLVDTAIDIFFPEEEAEINSQESIAKAKAKRSEILKKHDRYAKALNEYLNKLFEDDRMRERLKLWVINQLAYGNAFAQIVPKYNISKTKRNGKIEERVVGKRPSLDICSWTEMYYDARYKMLEDMPGVVRVRKNIRHYDLLQNKKYFNLDKLDELSSLKYGDKDSYAQLIFSITGMSDIKVETGVDKDSLDLQIFEGKFSPTGEPKDEGYYEITTINGILVIGFEEKLNMTYTDIKGHEDPEVFRSVGLISPIMGLQDELNFEKNAHATAISKSLNRSYYWAPESGVDPATLFTDRPSNIIVCNNGVEQAKRNLEEVGDRQLPAQYFSNINDYNRDIQSLSHTTDVSQQGGQTALTNTATGARISFFESNAVIAELRKNFEKGMQELAFKILDWVVDNVEEDIIIKKMNDGEFLKMNIEAIRDAAYRYNIKVEANSSSFDDVENRRADAIAIKNLLIEAANAGANVDINEGFRNVFSTFEQLDLDKLMPEKKEEMDIGQALGGQQGNIPKGQEPEKKPSPTTPAELTSAVAGGANLFQ